MIAKLGAYDFLAMIPTGSILLFGWYLIYRGAGPLSGVLSGLSGLPSFKGGWGDLGLLAIIVFVVGELMHASARFLERIWWRAMGGWPSVRLLQQIWKDDYDGKWHCRDAKIVRFFHSDQLTELSPELSALLRTKIQIEFGCTKPKDSKAYFVIQRQMYAFVHQAKRAKRIDVFIRNYGLYSGLLVTFATLAVLAWCHSQYPLMWLFAAAAAICLFGTYATGHDCSGELALQFLNVSLDDREL